MAASEAITKYITSFPLRGRHGGRALLIALLTLAAPNKVTPLRGFLSFFPYYVQYSVKRLAAGLSVAFSRYNIEFTREYTATS
jgi:hypothetical protein